jgi:hypothetical protein
VEAGLRQIDRLTAELEPLRRQPGYAVAPAARMPGRCARPISASAR